MPRAPHILALAGLAAAALSTTARGQPWAHPVVVPNTRTSITAQFPFNTRGHSTWGITTTPVLDVFGSDYGGGATFTPTIGGVTFTKSGVVTAAVATPFAFGLFTGTQQTGMLFDGSTGYFTTADPFGTLASFWLAGIVCPDDATLSEDIASQDDGGSNRKWVLVQAAGTAQLYVFKTNVSYSVVQLVGAFKSGACSAFVGSYDNSGGDGAAVLRMNVDGTDATALTTGVSPPQAVTPAFALGARSTGALPFKGRIARWTVKTGAVLTQAQLKAMVLSMLGEIGSSGQQVTCTRATAAQSKVNGTWHTLANNVCSIDENGLYVTGSAINYFLNSAAPATQDVTLTAVAHTAWMEGASGSVALTVNSATATGLPCTVSAGSDCHFTVTGAGTVTATVSAGPTHVQVENSAQRTSRITTAGSTVQRNGLNASHAPGAGVISEAQGQICATVTLPSDWTAAFSSRIIGTASANTVLYVSTATAVGIYDGTNSIVKSGLTSLVGRSARLCGSWGPGGLSVKEVGVAPATGSYDGNFGLGTLYFGAQAGAAQWLQGWVKDVRLCSVESGCE